MKKYLLYCVIKLLNVFLMVSQVQLAFSVIFLICFSVVIFSSTSLYGKRKTRTKFILQGSDD